MKNYIIMAHEFCENHRVFDRFSSRAVSLQRLGYESRDVSRLLRDTKEEWRRDNVPSHFSEQLYPYPCAARCGKCQDAYAARRVSRFSQTVQAFADLYAPRGWLEFQTLTVPPFAPKPEHISDVLHNTEPTERVYQGWLSEYLSARVQAARDSLERCIEHWRAVGRRRCVNPNSDILFREYEDVPVRFPRAALRVLPKDLLSQSEVQRVYGIITNQVKLEARDDVALERGFSDVSELFQAAPEESHERLEELLSAIAIERLRELKKTGEFSERVKKWFSHADAMTQGKLESDVGFVGGLMSEQLVNEVNDAWLLACWQEGWLQACIESARVYIPLQAERRVRRRGRPVVRQEYTADTEPNLNPAVPSIISLPEDCPVFRLPRAVVTEMLALHRKRLRRQGIQFRYISVSESGQSGEHNHVHAVVGYDQHNVPPDASQRVFRSIKHSRDGIRRSTQLEWHKVSGNVIWQRGKWSTAVREPERIGSYMGKYLSKDGGRQTWVSHNLGLRRYVQERRLIDVGMLSERLPVVEQLEHGGLRFQPSFSDEELDNAGAVEWVGLSRVAGTRLKKHIIPNHVRVEAVAFSTVCPSLGTAAGALCLHRVRGVVDVIPRCDLWLPLSAFLSLYREGLHSPVPAVSRLFRELSIATGKVAKDFRADHAGYQAAYVAQQDFGVRAFESLQSDWQRLSGELVGILHSPRGP